GGGRCSTATAGPRGGPALAPEQMASHRRAAEGHASKRGKPGNEKSGSSGVPAHTRVSFFPPPSDVSALAPRPACEPSQSSAIVPCPSVTAASTLRSSSFAAMYL